MDRESAEEQITDTAERTGIDENKGENKGEDIPGSEMGLNASSMTDASVSTRQGMINESIQSELENSDEMDICITATDPTANNTESPNANNTRDPTVNNTEDFPVINTIGQVVNNTRDLLVDDTTDHIANNTANLSADLSARSNEKNPTGSANLLQVEEAHNNYTPAKYNENLEGGPQVLSSAPSHNIDPAKEPFETPASTHHEMQEAHEPNEMSNTADLRMDPTESPNNKKETQLFNYVGCPDKVRQQILRYLLLSDEYIKPYWNFGSLEVADHISSRENFTTMIVAFAGNKELLDEATTILYGENEFSLEHGKVSLWWLKRIGPNISKLKHLRIAVEEGVMDQFGTRYETPWVSIFYLLEKKQNLQSLAVNFAQWTMRIHRDDGLDPEDCPYVWEPRYDVLRSLLSFRGLDMAVVEPGPFVTERCADILQDALVMGPGQMSDAVLEMAADIQPPTRAKYSP